MVWLRNTTQISVKAQIEMLKSEGLSFSNERQAEHLLQNISMFRLKSYFKPFRKNDSKVFKPGASFEKVYLLYKFDSELRKIVFSEL